MPGRWFSNTAAASAAGDYAVIIPTDADTLVTTRRTVVHDNDSLYETHIKAAVNHASEAAGVTSTLHFWGVNNVAASEELRGDYWGSVTLTGGSKVVDASSGILFDADGAAITGSTKWVDAAVANGEVADQNTDASPRVRVVANASGAAPAILKIENLCQGFIIEVVNGTGVKTYLEHMERNTLT